MKAATEIQTRVFSPKCKNGKVSFGIRYITLGGKSYIALTDVCTALDIFKSSQGTHCRSDNAKRSISKSGWVKHRISYVTDAGTKNFRLMIMLTEGGIEEITERSAVTWCKEFQGLGGCQYFPCRRQSTR